MMRPWAHRRVGMGVTIVVGCALACASAWAANRANVVEPLATVTLGRRPTAIAVDDRAGRALVVDDLDNTISVLETRRGQLVRTLGVRLYGHREGLHAIAVDTRIGRAYAIGSGLTVGSASSAFASDITIVDTRRATIIGVVSLSGLVRGVAVDDRRALVSVLTDGDAVNRGGVRVFDATTGAPLRTMPAGASPVAMAVDRRTGHILVVSQGTPGAITATGTVSVRDARTGHPVWSAAVGQRPMDIAIDGRTGHAFVSNNRSGTISVLDARSGRILATTAVGRQPDAVAVDEQAGHVFVTDIAANAVSMLDARSGKVLRTVRVGVRPLVITVDTRTHRALIANDVSGTVTVLDSVTGLVLRTVRVGLDPVDAAVDERTGRAFVLNLSASGARPSSLPLVSCIRALLGRVAPASASGGDSVGSVSVVDAAH